MSVYQSDNKSASINNFWIKKGTNCVSLNSCLPEADEIEAISNLHSKDIGLTNGIRRSQLINGTVPHSSYVCHKCNRTGHFKHACPLLLEFDSNSSNSSSSSISSQQAIKRATGIPRSDLIPLKTHVPGAYMTSEGTYAIPRKDAEAILNADSTVDWETSAVERSSPVENSSGTTHQDDCYASSSQHIGCQCCNEKIMDAAIAPCCPVNNVACDSSSSSPSHDDYSRHHQQQQPNTTTLCSQTYYRDFNSNSNLVTISNRLCPNDQPILNPVVNQFTNNPSIAAAAAATLLLPSIVSFNNEFGARLDPSKAEVALNIAKTANILQAAIVNASIGNLSSTPVTAGTTGCVGNLPLSEIDASALLGNTPLIAAVAASNSNQHYYIPVTVDDIDENAIITAVSLLDRQQFDFIKHTLITLGIDISSSHPSSTSDSKSDISLNNSGCNSTSIANSVDNNSPRLSDDGDSGTVPAVVDDDTINTSTTAVTSSPSKSEDSVDSIASSITNTNGDIIGSCLLNDNDDDNGTNSDKSIKSNTSADNDDVVNSNPTIVSNDYDEDTVDKDTMTNLDKVNNVTEDRLVTTSTTLAIERADSGSNSYKSSLLMNGICGYSPPAHYFKSNDRVVISSTLRDDIDNYAVNSSSSVDKQSRHSKNSNDNFDDNSTHVAEDKDRKRKSDSGSKSHSSVSSKHSNERKTKRRSKKSVSLSPSRKNNKIVQNGGVHNKSTAKYDVKGIRVHRHHRSRNGDNDKSFLSNTKILKVLEYHETNIKIVADKLKPRLVSHVHTVDKENRNLDNVDNKKLESGQIIINSARSNFVSSSSSSSCLTSSSKSSTKKKNKDKKKKNHHKSSKKHRSKINRESRHDNQLNKHKYYGCDSSNSSSSNGDASKRRNSALSPDYFHYHQDKHDQYYRRHHNHRNHHNNILPLLPRHKRMDAIIPPSSVVQNN
ncbi:hypothetical protein GJ496_004903 [Pomphorhynchus laevis]|nr:hypothetical protein GJ496_004903 [Pomphorhynchus laevis]